MVASECSVRQADVLLALDVSMLPRGDRRAIEELRARIYRQAPLLLGRGVTNLVTAYAGAAGIEVPKNSVLGQIFSWSNNDVQSSFLLVKTFMASMKAKKDPIEDKEAYSAQLMQMLLVLYMGLGRKADDPRRDGQILSLALRHLYAAAPTNSQVQAMLMEFELFVMAKEVRIRQSMLFDCGLDPETGAMLISISMEHRAAKDWEAFQKWMHESVYQHPAAQAFGMLAVQRKGAVVAALRSTLRDLRDKTHRDVHQGGSDGYSISVFPFNVLFGSEHRFGGNALAGKPYVDRWFNGEYITWYSRLHLNEEAVLYRMQQSEVDERPDGYHINAACLLDLLALKWHVGSSRGSSESLRIGGQEIAKGEVSAFERNAQSNYRMPLSGNRKPSAAKLAYCLEQGIRLEPHETLAVPKQEPVRYWKKAGGPKRPCESKGSLPCLDPGKMLAAAVCPSS